MDKDKELELKVQMFCAAVGGKGIDSFFRMERLAEVVNEAFEALKNQEEES